MKKVPSKQANQLTCKKRNAILKSNQLMAERMNTMRITFLGSSHGVPEPNRKCTCIMIETAGRHYFIDMGVMLFDELITRGIPVDSVKGVFVTHLHGDHTNGLPHFIDLLSWYFKTPEPVICVPNLQAIEAVFGWIRANAVEPRALEYREVKPGCIYDDGFISVTAYATQHCDRSFAYLVKAEGKTILFTGDLKHPSVDFPAINDALDLLVCESAHFSSLDYAPILKEKEIKQVCIHHYSSKWHADALQLITEMPELPIKLATDGLTYNL